VSQPSRGPAKTKSASPSGELGFVGLKLVDDTPIHQILASHGDDVVGRHPRGHGAVIGGEVGRVDDDVDI